MRTDYPLYIIAVICFVAAIYAYTTLAETSLYLYALAVLGIVFLGLGYMVRPKSTAITTAPAPRPSTELPPETPKPEPKEESEKASTKEQTQKKKTTRRRRKKKA